MKKYIIKLVNAVLKNMYAKKRYYSLFYFAYLQALRGMDHGYAYIYPESSGEFDIMKKVAAFYRKNAEKVIFFDVGANTGYYAKEIVKIFDGKAAIHCFEPSQHTYDRLIENVNGLVIPHKVALSNNAGIATLTTDQAGSGLASLVDTTFSPAFGIAKDLSEQVTTVMLDNFCAEHNINKIHVLKMDIEGHEFAVLEGASSLLQKRAIDMIQFEFGHVNIDSRSPLKGFYKLLQHDFNIYRIVQSGLIPQFTYNYEYEIYLGTNFLAVRKDLAFDKELQATL